MLDKTSSHVHGIRRDLQHLECVYEALNHGSVPYTGLDTIYLGPCEASMP